MYAAVRQDKAKTGMAEELACRIKESPIPIISDVEGFMAYYVVYAPDDTVTVSVGIGGCMSRNHHRRMTWRYSEKLLAIAL